MIEEIEFENHYTQFEDHYTQKELEALGEQRFQQQYCTDINNESLGLWDRDFF